MAKILTLTEAADYLYGNRYLKDYSLRNIRYAVESAAKKSHSLQEKRKLINVAFNLGCAVASSLGIGLLDCVYNTFEGCVDPRIYIAFEPRSPGDSCPEFILEHDPTNLWEDYFRFGIFNNLNKYLKHGINLYAQEYGTTPRNVLLHNSYRRCANDFKDITSYTSKSDDYRFSKNLVILF